MVSYISNKNKAFTLYKTYALLCLLNIGGNLIGQKKEATLTQRALAFVFAMAIIVSFALVYWVDYEYKSEVDNEVLFTTDSATDFLTLDYTRADYYDVRTSGVYEKLGANWYNYSKNPVFLGNNTWSMSVNETTSTVEAFAWYVIELPNLDKWAINDITVNLTKNTDSDLTFSLFIGTLPTAGVIDNANSYSDIQIYQDTTMGAISGIYYNKTVTLDLATALNVYDNAKANNQYHIVVKVNDKDADGLSAYSFKLNMEITGKRITNFDVEESLSIVLAIDVIMLTVVFAFMDDDIDFGPTTKDLPGGKTKKGAKKGKKR